MSFTPHGSGSYVMDTLYTGTESEPAMCVSTSFAANQPGDIFPDWILRLRFVPYSFKPQYWVARNQASERSSNLIIIKGTDMNRASPLWLFLAVSLAWLPAVLAHFKGRTVPGVALAVWLLLYQPWQAWMA